MNSLKANTNKPWLSSDYDVPVLDNEEMWSQKVIDETTKDVWLDIDRKENESKEQHNQNTA